MITRKHSITLAKLRGKKLVTCALCREKTGSSYGTRKIYKLKVDNEIRYLKSGVVIYLCSDCKKKLPDVPEVKDFNAPFPCRLEEYFEHERSELKEK